tara:strand:+ start:17341 stop:17736 length:396 start_codon:yes stop_codon:yes gene_type:complete
MKLSIRKPDTIGAIASILCLVHCIITPMLFAVQGYIAANHKFVSTWWKNLDFLFIAVSAYAINRSVKNSSKKTMRVALWICWFILFFLIINEKLEWLSLDEVIIYVSSSTLAILHIYNLKYCQCKTDDCCK